MKGLANQLSWPGSLVLACAIFASAASGNAVAQVYKWTDAQGHVQYGDKPPDNASTKQIATPAAAGFIPGQDVEVAESIYDYFDVYGTTVAQLDGAREAYGPTAISIRDGKPFKAWANCGWRVTWKFTPFIREGGQCRIDKFKVMVTTHIQFPRWVNRSEGSTELQNKWDTFTRAVRTHEDGHKQNGVRAANDMANELYRLSLQNCDSLSAKIGEIGKRNISKYSLADQAWDRGHVNGPIEEAYFR